MKRISIFAIIAVFSMVLFTACGPQLSPFTQSLYEANRWEKTELQQIQFYLSEDVVLRRVASNSDSRIQDGKIRMKRGQNVEEIIIRRGTPGVLIYLPREDRFAVSFEDGSTDKTLMFGPDSRRGNRYILKVAEWKDGKGIVRYDNKGYYIYHNDAIATLMVDLRKIKRTTVSSRTARGAEVK